MRRALAGVMLVLALWPDLGPLRGQSAPSVAQVARVVDGDTIEVVLPGGRTETVHYLGADTPEAVPPDQPGGCFGLEAYEYNRRLVAGRTVWFELDAVERDRAGALLAYVFLDRDRQAMVNAIMVSQGFAQAVIVPPNVGYADRLLELQQEARRARRGLWAACADAASSSTEKANP